MAQTDVARFAAQPVHTLSGGERQRAWLALILAGLLANMVFAAIAAVISQFYSDLLLGIMVWGAGSLLQDGWATVTALLWTSLAAALALALLYRPLMLLALDDEQARRLGAPVGLLRLLVLLLAAGVTAQVVSRLGVISFAGLAGASVAHLLRVRAMGARFALSFLAGGLLLLVVDSLLNIAGHFLGTLLPAGALCGVLGAPFLIFLVLRQRKSAQGFAREAPPSAPSPRLASWCTPLLGLAALLLLIVLLQGFSAGADGWGWHWQGELILDHRLPRSLSAMAVGVMLACAGVLLQTLTRNPMASPEVLGISSGVALAVIAAFLAFPALGSGGLLLAGAGGALMVAVLVLWLARRLQPAWLLVTGVAIAALMQGVMTVVQLSGNPQLQGVLSWLAGSTWYARPHTAPLLVLLALVLLAAALLCGKALQLLALGETVAGSLGLAVRRSRSLLLVLVALMSAVATLAVGPLSFIGLMTPHLARRSGAVSPEKQLPIAALYGAALMLVADWLGRYLIFPYELGAGVIASLLGGGFFLLLLRQARPIN